MIKSKKLKSIIKRIDGIKIKVVSIDEFRRVFPEVSTQDIFNGLSSDNHMIITDNIPDYHNKNKVDIKEEIKTVIKEYFDNNISQIYKPLEENALVKYGAVSKENEFLRQRLEVLVSENAELKEQMKMLPDLKTVQELQANQEVLRQENDLLKEQIKALPDPSELQGKDNVILATNRT